MILHSTRALARHAIVLASLPAAVACAGSRKAAPDAGSAGHTIVIRLTDSLTISPAHATVAVGDTIEWINAGVLPHTVTAKPGAAGNPEHVSLPAGAAPFDSGILEGGHTFRQVIQTAGEYTYFCAFHETQLMVGHLTVR